MQTYKLTISTVDGVREASPDETMSYVASIIRRPKATLSALTGPAAVKDYLAVTLHGLTAEAFYVVFLNSQHRPLACERMFNGTINSCAVYPREIARQALSRNASAVILAHNHPSGDTTPSAADEVLTRRVREALALLEITVLDHIIVSDSGTYSFAAHGLL